MKRIDYTPATFLAVLVLAASPAVAQDLSPVSDMIDTVVDAVTGPIGRGLGVLALVGSGVMMFFGRLNWPIFVAVFVGVVLIFSAETIIDGFAAP
ncbi:TrbC/VIRB2 family protein [Roseovarius sp. EC-HK134]|jgi:type IV secretion system protein VirB2|uniref:TrbC/VirB2 family protein n=1 Tax=unclassified Roseovarius TaxID=2614913 RepID=UPI0009B50C21|nr:MULTISPECIES: TrbC/VirB2 family protein [unclassified Roseovarius]MBC7180908.1 TrbC/VirB2 family protein [Roseovarius sp.]GAW35537.1 trbC/VIRB2 family protein [Roseovarius sp. A-2]VVS97644.1 TrbC/VIRB2 family protein [Roseovarius sp. EC-SD190]VVT33819.1 TrbC/VIRB2 family protein [Roseovarius sp. EC-HK134]